MHIFPWKNTFSLLALFYRWWKVQRVQNFEQLKSFVGTVIVCDGGGDTCILRNLIWEVSEVTDGSLSFQNLGKISKLWSTEEQDIGIRPCLKNRAKDTEKLLFVPHHRLPLMKTLLQMHHSINKWAKLYKC